MQNASTKERGFDTDEALQEGEKRIKDIAATLEKKLKQGQEQAKKVFQEVDQKVHENPWPVIGGVAIGCVLLGFIMGLSKKQ